MRFTRLDSEIRHGMDAGWHPGVQVCVMRDGEVLLDQGFGYAAPDQLLTNDHFTLWMSATKPMTAMGLARLWERGKVDLQAPVAEIIPEFGQHGKEEITIWHLLTHIGGLRSADIGWKPRPWDASIELICNARKEPKWELGKKAGYHIDASWYLLGEIIHRIDGREFSQYMRDEIFLALNCSQAWIGMPAPEIDYFKPLISPVYDTSVQPAEEITLFSNPSVLALVRPGANGRGPARVLAKFYAMLLQGGSWEGRTLFKPETVREFTRRHRVGMFDHSFSHTMDWGLGFHVNSHKGGPDTVPYGFGPHASLDSYGHAGNRSSMAFADPEHTLAVAVVCNGMAAEAMHQTRMRRILAALYEDLDLHENPSAAS